jgi:hypothetical protein
MECQGFTRRQQQPKPSEALLIDAKGQQPAASVLRSSGEQQASPQAANLIHATMMATGTDRQAPNEEEGKCGLQGLVLSIALVPEKNCGARWQCEVAKLLPAPTSTCDNEENAVLVLHR